MKHTLAQRYMKGFGLEIGPGKSPWVNPNNAHISYLDKAYNLDFKDISQCSSNNFDFVCASHLFEHLENPIKDLNEWLRILKQDGYILLVIPDKRETFDNPRELTDYDHLWAEYTIPGLVERHRRAHVIDFCINTKPIQRDNLNAMIDNPDYGVHYHTFTYDSLKEILTKLKMNIIHYSKHGMEIFCVIKKES